MDPIHRTHKYWRDLNPSKPGGQPPGEWTSDAWEAFLVLGAPGFDEPHHGNKEGRDLWTTQQGSYKAEDPGGSQGEGSQAKERHPYSVGFAGRDPEWQHERF